MTRINCIPPSELCRQHLVAEYRELPRVVTLAKGACLRGLTPETLLAPPAYTLGRGHVLFFYARLGFIVQRFHELVAEMDDRGYIARIRPFALCAGLETFPGRQWLCEWKPTPEAQALNRARIAERLSTNTQGA